MFHFTKKDERMKNNRNRILIAMLVFVVGSFTTIQAVFPPSFSGPGTLVLPGGIMVLDPGANQIDASTGNITVNMTGAQIIQADPSGSQLYLNVAGGNKITFNVTDVLQFWGSTGAGADLLIVQSGDGEVEWNISGGAAVVFTNDGSSGSTQYWLYMDTNGTQATFKRPTGATDAYVQMGTRSVLSFLSADTFGTTSAQATISFDPSNSSTGRMAFTIDNAASVVVAGHTSTNSNPLTITLADIDRATPAGNVATFEVVNSVGTAAGNAGLYILNSNNTYATSSNGQNGNLLADPFLVLGITHDYTATPPNTGAFSGVRYGWVLGANSVLSITDNAYVNYVGLSVNQNPVVTLVPDFQTSFKTRNPSAFVVDTYFNDLAVPAQVQFGADAALYFRSGVDNDGVVQNPFYGANPFTIDPAFKTSGTGLQVLDVEGPFDVIGQDQTTSGIQIFSLEVDNGSSSLFIDQSQTIFPGRTFATDGDGNYLQYNSACFLVNNHLRLFDTSLMHTDQNHVVVTKNSQVSEPTYIGGDTYKNLPAPTDPLELIMSRPKIEFTNSRFLINESVAVTGLDLLVPNIACDASDNNSTFTFFYNGYKLDDGAGRNMILGTWIGSLPMSPFGSAISTEAHLDIMPVYQCFLSRALVPGNPNLVLDVAPNNCKINQDLSCTIPNPIDGQISTHSIFLNCNSNISIGTNNDAPYVVTTADSVLEIAGNSFSFDTGVWDKELIGVTGEGGIFVDYNGIFTINPGLSATVNTMVVRSHNGIVDLPVEEVVFRDGLGITNWQPDMSVPAERILVAEGEYISDFSMNWALQIIKDYDGGYVPFPIFQATDCSLPTVDAANITAIPVINGYVDQFQIQGSRYSDPATIMVDGGTINELVFLEGCEPGEYRGAIVVLQNNGVVGIGSASRNTDSVYAAVELGRNGVVFIVNGSGKVILNDDVFTQGACAFITGPDYNPATDVFEVEALTTHQIRVTKNNIFDLRGMGFDSSVNMKGYAQVNFESGSKLLLGGGTLNFDDYTQLNFKPAQATEVQSYFALIDSTDLGPVNNNAQTAAQALQSIASSATHNEFQPLTGYGSSLGLANNTTGLRNTDAFRVRLIGIGTLQFNDYSQANLPEYAFVGVETINETDRSCGLLDIPVTALTIVLADSAQFNMGSSTAHETGGVLQVGDVYAISDHTVAFGLEFNGDAAQFILGPKAFLGLGVGVVRAGQATLNEFFVDNLFNVETVVYNHFNGQWTHNRIFSGDDVNASLIALGQGAAYDQSFGAEVGAFFDMTNNDSNILGGGNLALITASTLANNNAGAIAPIVRTENGGVTISGSGGTTATSQRLNVGMFSSMFMRRPTAGGLGGQIVNVTGQTASQIFDLWKMTDALTPSTTAAYNPKYNYACAGPLGESFSQTYDQIRLGYTVVIPTATTPSQILRFEISNNQILSGAGGIGAGQAPSVNATTALNLGFVHANLNPVDGSFFLVNVTI